MSRAGAVLGPRGALGLLVVVLVVGNVSRSTVVPGTWHLWFNLALGGSAVAVAVAAGLSVAELGLARADLGAGLRLGGVVFAAVSLVVVVLGLAGLLSDDRTDVDGATVLVRTLVLIPIGTVLVEELTFRGVLHGLLARMISPVKTLVVGSVLFGLWHALPVWRGGGVETDVAELGRAATVAGTVATTTLAGAGFVWLRTRSGSLAAPALAHLATNSVTFALAWAFR